MVSGSVRVPSGGWYCRLGCYSKSLFPLWCLSKPSRVLMSYLWLIRLPRGHCEVLLLSLTVSPTQSLTQSPLSVNFSARPLFASTWYMCLSEGTGVFLMYFIESRDPIAGAVVATVFVALFLTQHNYRDQYLTPLQVVVRLGNDNHRSTLFRSWDTTFNSTRCNSRNTMRVAPVRSAPSYGYNGTTLEIFRWKMTKTPSTQLRSTWNWYR